MDSVANSGTRKGCPNYSHEFKRQIVAADSLPGTSVSQLAMEHRLKEDPFSGHVFVFRGRRSEMIKLLWWTGDGLCLLAKRLERGRFIWPQAADGTVSLSQAQLSMLLDGIDWRRPERTWKPTSGL